MAYYAVAAIHQLAFDDQAGFPFEKQFHEQWHVRHAFGAELQVSEASGERAGSNAVYDESVGIGVIDDLAHERLRVEAVVRLRVWNSKVHRSIYHNGRQHLQFALPFLWQTATAGSHGDALLNNFFGSHRSHWVASGVLAELMDVGFLEVHKFQNLSGVVCMTGLFRPAFGVFLRHHRRRLKSMGQL